MFKAPHKFLKAWLLLLSVAYCQNAYSAEGGGVGPDLDGDGHPDFVIVDFGADGKKGGGDDRLAPYQSGYPYYANDYPNSYYVDTNDDGYADLYYYSDGQGGYKVMAVVQPVSPVSTTPNADNFANAIIDARDGATGDGGQDTQNQSRTTPVEDEFRSLRNFSNFNVVLADSLRPLKDVRMLQTVNPYNAQATGNHLEDILETLAKHGPLSMPVDDKRVWISPFYTFGRQQNAFSQPGNKSWLSGAIMGAEYRNLKQKWTVGLMSGLLYGRQEELGNSQSFTKTKGLSVGAYHSLTFLGEARYDIMGTRTLSFQDNQRHQIAAGNKDYYAISDHKMYTDVVDTKLTYLFILNQMWSVRPSLGNTYIRNQSGSYSERGAGIYNQNKNASNSSSNEVYGGIGVRAGWKFGEKKIRITGVYEHGYQYEKSGSPTVIALNIPGSAPIVTPQDNKKTKTHYVHANASYYDAHTKLKFLVGYSGAYQQIQKNHSFTLKAEYRF